MKEKEIYKIIMTEHRCPNCNRLLFKGKIRGDYNIEIKCPRCKKSLNLTEKQKDKSHRALFIMETFH